MAVIRGFVALSLALAGTFAAADDERAHVNYMLHCQGCHLPQAEGFAGRVPPMKDFVGYFLHSAEGRDFLIRVPGVAHSALGDIEITELMNWLLQNFSADQLPATFAPFTVDEVANLRQDPESAPDAVRIEILGRIAADLPTLADALAHQEQ
ncbi:MAG: cytochrome c, class I [Woeseiaceae bacterium]